MLLFLDRYVRDRPAASVAVGVNAAS